MTLKEWADALLHFGGTNEHNLAYALKRMIRENPEWAESITINVQLAGQAKQDEQAKQAKQAETFTLQPGQRFTLDGHDCHVVTTTPTYAEIYNEDQDDTLYLEK